MVHRSGKSALAVCAAVALTSISQSHGQKLLKPDKFDVVATDATNVFLYTFDYGECRPSTGLEAVSTFKDYNAASASTLFDLTAVHDPPYSKCAGDIEAEFDDANFKLSNGLRLPGGDLVANVALRDAVKTGTLQQSNLFSALCGGSEADGCTYENFGFTLEMWINIKDYDTAFPNGVITDLFEMNNRMEMKVVREGTGDNQLKFSLDGTTTLFAEINNTPARSFKAGLNFVTVVVQHVSAFNGLYGNLYLNDEELASSKIATATASTAFDDWSGDTVLRMGSSAAGVGNMFNGAIHLTGLRYTPASGIGFGPNHAAVLARGLPNNPPVIIPDAYIFVDEDVAAIVDTALTADFNPNATSGSSVQIYDFDSANHSTVFDGSFTTEQAFSLSIDTPAIPSTLTATVDGVTLIVKNADDDAFTVYDNSICVPSLNLATLPVIVTDQGCGSTAATGPCASEVSVGVCVVSTKDQLALVPFPATSFQPKYQASTPLTIEVTDKDNSDGTQYDYTVQVIPNPAKPHVQLREYKNGMCNETDPEIPLTFTLSGTTTLVVCYKYTEEGLNSAENASKPQVLRSTDLTVKVARGEVIPAADSLDEITSATMLVDIINPISTCEAVQGVPSPCEVSSVKENTVQSSDGVLSDTTGNTFTLSVQDSRGLGAAGFYKIKLDTVPDATTQGSLYLASDTELATPLVANALLAVTALGTNSPTDATGEMLRFVPVADFFTRVATSGIPEYGTDAAPFVYTKDLAMSEGGFLGCATTAAPGCAVTFVHSIIKLATIDVITDIESTSPVGTVAVHVQAVETRINEDELIFPEGNMTYFRDDPAIKFTGDLAIQFNATGTLDTTDDDAFPVQILVSSSTGNFTSSIPAASKLGLAFESGLVTNTDGSGGADSSCIRTSCSSTFLIRGAPSLINDALAILTYIPTSATGTKTIKIQVADSNKIKAFEKTFDIIVTSETSPTESGLGTTIIIVLGSVGGIVLCVCLGVTCLILSKVTCFVRVGYGFCGLFSHSAREHKLHMDREAARKRRGSYDSDSDVEEGRKHRKGGEGGRHGGGGGRRDSVDSRDDRRDRRHRSRDRREKKERDRHFDRSSKTFRAHAPSDIYASGDKEAKTLVVVPADSLLDWEKHIDKDTGDVYFFNPKSGVSQWHPPTVKSAQS